MALSSFSSTQQPPKKLHYGHSSSSKLKPIKSPYMTSYSSSTVTMSFSSIISELQQLTGKKICIFCHFSPLKSHLKGRMFPCDQAYKIWSPKSIISRVPALLEGESHIISVHLSSLNTSMCRQTDEHVTCH